jgi:hypothetical protein
VKSNEIDARTIADFLGLILLPATACVPPQAVHMQEPATWLARFGAENNPNQA